MGYYTSVTGLITIDPPITWGELYDTPWAAGEDDYEHDVQLQIVSTYEETDEGTLERKFATAIVPASEDGYKAYRIEEHLQDILTRFAVDGRTFRGYLQGEGEDNEDVWRLSVRSGQPHMSKARLVFDE